MPRRSLFRSYGARGFETFARAIANVFHSLSIGLSNRFSRESAPLRYTIRRKYERRARVAREDRETYIGLALSLGANFGTVPLPIYMEYRGDPVWIRSYITRLSFPINEKFAFRGRRYFLGKPVSALVEMVPR